jgi:very-short-patch-repair endonuclease
MPGYRKRPRKNLPPPLAGGGNQSNAMHSIDWGRGKTSVSRQLRAEASEAEQKLWRLLRQKQLNGLRFRRQFPLGPYFADFVCLPVRLVVEVDGSQHGEETRVVRDEGRTAWLTRNNFRVIRFPVSAVMADIEMVIEGIEMAMQQPLPQMIMRGAHDHLPPPARGGGT